MSPLVAFVNSLLNILMLGIHHVIDTMSYGGVVLLMAIESANIPLPSEFVLPYAGYMVQQNHLNFHLTAFAGALGCLLGSLPSYALGAWGGRPFLQKHGKWLLLTEHDLESAERWTQKYGDWAFFLCRMLPVVRTFISLPAGILNARLLPFAVFTFIGSLAWSYALVYAGVVLGENLETFKAFWHKFDLIIILVFGALAVLYVWKHLRHFQAKSKRNQAVNNSPS